MFRLPPCSAFMRRGGGAERAADYGVGSRADTLNRLDSGLPRATCYGPASLAAASSPQHGTGRSRGGLRHFILPAFRAGRHCPGFGFGLWHYCLIAWVLAATYFYVYTVMQVPTGIFVDLPFGPRSSTSLAVLLLQGVAYYSAWCSGALEDGARRAYPDWPRCFRYLYFDVSFSSRSGVQEPLCQHGRSQYAGRPWLVLAGFPLSWLAQTAGWRSVFIAVAGISLLGLLGTGAGSSAQSAG